MNTLLSRRILVLLVDSSAILAAFILSFLLRFDFVLDPEALLIIAQTWPVLITTHLVTAYGFGLYQGIYHYSSFADLVRIAKAVGSSGFIFAAVIMFIRQGQFPRSILLLHPMLALLGIGGIRFGIRFIKSRMRIRGLSYGDRSAILIGAGELGESIARQILKTPESSLNILGFIDDDPAKWGMHIHDIPVLGGRKNLTDLLIKHSPDELIISTTKQRGEIVRDVMDTLRTLDKRPELKIAPALSEMLKTHGPEVAIRKVNPADLLNRGVVKIDEAAIAKLLERKRVLVTGAGGSIGAELCRQILRYQPEKLILLENHANSLFYADHELKESAKGTALIPALGDTRDLAFIDRLFSEHKPQVVIHAAAHKHVHQLEFNVAEGISNNLLGTYHLCSASDKHHAEIFILISTDKAVRPASILGATKRAAEQVVRAFSGSKTTRFAAVRFGNVLGSTGSVLRIFEEQIHKGGPITVTDDKVTRYFMVVEEAIALILQAASMTQGGEVFILKMGTPVRILDMAKNLVLLHGLEPDKDIEIKVTGLKQGEKMDEELVEDSSHLIKSKHPDIMTLQTEGLDLSEMKKRVLDLEILARGSDTSAMLKKLQDLVPTFKPAPMHLGAGDA